MISVLLTLSLTDEASGHEEGAVTEGNFQPTCGTGALSPKAHEELNPPDSM